MVITASGTASIKTENTRLHAQQPCDARGGQCPLLCHPLAQEGSRWGTLFSSRYSYVFSISLQSPAPFFLLALLCYYV